MVKDGEVGMSDLIPRDKAIECIWKPKVKPDAEIFNALKMAIQSEIEQLPTVTPESGWISVKDRLPDKNTQYIVSFKTGGVTSAWYFDYRGGFYVGGIFVSENVTHWMPLPEPPKEGCDA